MFDHVTMLEGFQHPEKDLEGPFIWTQQRFSLRRRTSHPYWHLKLCYYGADGILFVECAGRRVDEIRLGRNWNTYALDLSGHPWERIDFRLNKLHPVIGDSRELGVMIRFFEPLRDRSEFTSKKRVGENKRLNELELALGKTKLESFPPRLRIDLEDRCTVKPNCVYCAWEWVKEQEKPNKFIFTKDSLTDLGDFFDLADEVVDCSYGEPMLNPDFGPIVERITSADKHFELTSNGQVMTADKRRYMLGRKMTLYISIDAATSDIYSRYRNNAFVSVIKNLRALCEEKKLHNSLPRVIVTFIVMRSNISTFPEFLSLMQEIGVDAVNVRNLNKPGLLSERRVMSEGRLFDFDVEALPWNEFETFVETARQATTERGMAFISTVGFIENEAADDGSLCAEPWKSIYVLRRGIMPCCFASPSKVMANLGERGSLSLSEFLYRFWNSDAYQELRASLAAGRFGEHCKRSSHCIIVSQRKASATPRFNK